MGDKRCSRGSALIKQPAFKLVFGAFVLCTLSSVIVNQCEGHVALTFPPARKFDLDFLDNSRTKGPCGMPKGKLKMKNLFV